VITTISAVTIRPTIPQMNRLAGDRLAVDHGNFTPADGHRGGAAKTDDRQNAGHDQALVERAHDRAVGAELDEEGADDRGDDRGAADRQRIEHRRSEHIHAAKEDRCQNHGGDHGHRIGFEQVSGHAGAIADIVADIVCDGGRVAWIVFRDAGFDLADEVAADIRTLGEDAAAQTGEDRNQRSAEAKRNERIDHLRLSVASAIGPVRIQ
jgi:hypothetical protein